MNERIAPQDGNAELNRLCQSCRRIACMQIQISEILAWSLVDDSEKDAEREVVNQPARYECRGAEGGPRSLRVIRGRRARATVFLVMKPNQPLILQVVIDGENGYQRNRFRGHWRQQSNPVHR